MNLSRELKALQKAKSKAQTHKNLKEEAGLCNQLGELLAKNGDFKAAIEEHKEELALSKALGDVIGCAVANRKIGECFAEMGNCDLALKHQQRHLDLARSVEDAAEEQRALATIGRTYLFRYESDQSQESLGQAKEAFKKSLAIVDERLQGVVPTRELGEMKARLFLNLGCVYDALKEPQRCSDLIRRCIFLAEKNCLLEDLYRANCLLGNIHFRNGQHSRATRCLEQAKECARKLKDKFSESESFHSIGQVQLSLGDFIAARRSLKKAFTLGSQQAADHDAVKKALKQAIRGCKLEEAVAELHEGQKQDAMGLAEQLGDLYCKVGCYSKAVDSYMTQLSFAESLGKPGRELAVIHVSLAATYTDLRQHPKAIEHYKHELGLRMGNAKEECKTWLNIAVSQEEAGQSLEDLDSSYSSALRCADRGRLPLLQRRVLRLWLSAQQKGGSPQCDETQARLLELCSSEGLNPDSEVEDEEEEEEENSEPLEDSDIELSDSDDDDLEEYEKTVSGRRKTGRWNRRNEKGETTLHRACIEGNLRQVQYLVDQGHPVNPRDYCGWTPLHEACNHGLHDIVALLLDRGANINDPGGPMCEGVTPLHDALSCGHFNVARLLVEKGASVTTRNSRGETPLDSLHQWLKMYSRELDSETKQECAATEKMLRLALSGGITVISVPPKPPLQDSQLFDAENSEPLVPERCYAPQQNSPRTRSPPRSSALLSPKQRRTDRSCFPQRGTEADVLYREGSSDSEQPDSDASLSPLRPVQPRQRGLSVVPTAQEASPRPDMTSAHFGRELLVSGREEYLKAIQSLGSAKSRLLSQTLSEPAFSSTPVVPANSVSALVPEDEYIADDWLDDDLGEVQPKKKRKVSSEQECRQKSSYQPSTRSQNLTSAPFEPTLRASSSSRAPSLKKGHSKPRQLKMTQLSGMEVLGRREVSRSQNPANLDSDDNDLPAHQHVVPAPPAPLASVVPAPIRMRVRVIDSVFLIPVPHSAADSCTVSWLCDQAAQRYYQTCGLLPRLSLQKEGALLAPQDPLLAVLHTNEEVLAEVSSWDLPPLPERYKKACLSLAVEANARVLRLCEMQDGAASVSVCSLSLTPSSLSPLLRALKLQSGLTELRLAGNRLHDDLLPELVAAANTMPRLRVLDVSANQITGEGIKKAADALEGKGQPAFPCLEELNLSMNPLGDGHAQALSCLLSACPLLVTLSLEGCSLTARFLQQHRLLLASALAGSGHLKSVSLSHNALGSTGFELVLKTLPLHGLTHLYMSAVCRGPADPPALEHLSTLLSQGNISLTHLSLAGNGLTDHSVALLARCLSVCHSLVSLDLSANPDVTSAGLHCLLSAMKDCRQPLTHLNLQGCQVAGPWDELTLSVLLECVLDLRLCSQRLNKLDQQALQHCWGQQESSCSLFRQGKCMLRMSAPP
ncbi:tonsoku-like protein [Denticeps clupeoides]|uniref:tonsoku-like protein n=1 Tax=Denticeps clupeoides TaxID=299321 RepID=UPI0010A44C21|nr:tonsoku-like protein [Denticeps clupeoides]